MGVRDLSLKIRVVSEFRRKKQLHYQVQVKGDSGYFLCRGFDEFGKHPLVEGGEVNCRLCRSIFRGRGLKEQQEMKKHDESQ